MVYIDTFFMTLPKKDNSCVFLRFLILFIRFATLPTMKGRKKNRDHLFKKGHTKFFVKKPAPLGSVEPEPKRKYVRLINEVDLQKNNADVTFVDKSGDVCMIKALRKVRAPRITQNEEVFFPRSKCTHRPTAAKKRTHEKQIKKALSPQLLEPVPQSRRRSASALVEETKNKWEAMINCGVNE